MKQSVLYALLASEEELPFWKEVWAYFDNAYFADHSLVSLRNIVFGLFLGLSVASFAAVFNKRVLGKFVRTLLTEVCLTPENGKTLPELNYADKLMIRYAVRRSVTLRRVVKCREEEAYRQAETEAQAAYEEQRKQGASLPKRTRVKPFRVDPDRHHFYIPEELRYVADVKFEQKGTSWLGACVTVVVMFVLMIAVLLVLPYLLDLVQELAGSFTSSASCIMRG